MLPIDSTSAGRPLFAAGVDWASRSCGMPVDPGRLHFESIAARHVTRVIRLGLRFDSNDGCPRPPFAPTIQPLRVTKDVDFRRTSSTVSSKRAVSLRVRCNREFTVATGVFGVAAAPIAGASGTQPRWMSATLHCLALSLVDITGRRVPRGDCRTSAGGLESARRTAEPDNGFPTGRFRGVFVPAGSCHRESTLLASDVSTRVRTDGCE